MASIIKYSLLRLVRTKENLFWILLFPILLGCFFKAAFSNAGAAEDFSAIPAAIVCEEGEAAENFRLTADELGREGEDQMLSITYCDEKEALRLLKEKKIDGIIYAGDEVRLTISSDMQNAQINQSILKTFVEQYNVSRSIFEDVARTHPKQLPGLVASLSENTVFHEEVSLSYSGSDTFTQYFLQSDCHGMSLYCHGRLPCSNGKSGKSKCPCGKKEHFPHQKRRNPCGRIICQHPI